MRILRWAVSLLGVMGVVLFGVLWVRSIWWFDELSIPLRGNRRIWGTSIKGGIACGVEPGASSSEGIVAYAFPSDMWPEADWRQLARRVHFSNIDFSIVTVLFPHWLMMLAFGVIAAAPWLRWRFSVRGVLAFMAFVAVLFAVVELEWIWL